MVRSFALVVLVLSGCDTVFGLSTLDPTKAVAYDRCAPGGYDDPLRYAFIPTDTIGSTAWDDARHGCQLRGMDLVVFNDEHEMGMATEALWPYWIGVKSDGAAWATVDGCPAIGMTAPPLAQGANAPACGAMFDPLQPNGNSCDGVLTPTPDGLDHVSGVLCETPRPEAAACVPKDPTLETYTVSPSPMRYTAAVSFCQNLGDHLVVVDSFAELGVLSALVRDGNAAADFWLGATFDGTWTSVTACPAEFSWTELGPSFNGAPFPNCVAGITAMTDGTPGLQGMAIASCGDMKLAVCESD